MSAPPVLQGRALVRAHGRGDLAVRCLGGVDIDIFPGEFVVVCGPSGSGKSTLLNILGLLDPPDEGQVLLEGVTVPLHRPRLLGPLRGKYLGFVFQQFNLLPVLSAAENVELPLYETPLNATQRCDRAMSLLEAVGLRDRAHCRPAQMSGGQQQRTALARALVRHPRVVLADEPTANLDSESTRQVLDLMCSLSQQHQTAFVVATHDPRVVERATRVLRMCDGGLAP